MAQLYSLAHMTWPEFQEAAGQIELALIPLGSTEQHGPGGTFGVDTARAEPFAQQLAERLHPKAVVVPSFPYALSLDQMGFPGTITLRTETLTQVLEQVALSLCRHGIRKLFFITGHNGNGPVLNIVLAHLKERYPDVRSGWTSIGSLVSDLREAHLSGSGGHADEAEISECLYLAPHAVRTEALAAGDLVPGRPALKSLRLARPFHTVSRNGAQGNPVIANQALGQLLVTSALDRLEAYLRSNF